jgi:hypothetical protein
MKIVNLHFQPTNVACISSIQAIIQNLDSMLANLSQISQNIFFDKISEVVLNSAWKTSTFVTVVTMLAKTQLSLSALMISKLLQALQSREHNKIFRKMQHSFCFASGNQQISQHLTMSISFCFVVFAKCTKSHQLPSPRSLNIFASCTTFSILHQQVLPKLGKHHDCLGLTHTDKSCWCKK